MNIKENGFSLVEVLVSMVVLSIVVVIMTNTILMSDKSHSRTGGKDIANSLAQEKLLQLQDPSVSPQPGNDEVTKGGVTYKRSWTIGTTTPVKITVTVEWNKMGETKTIDMVGFLETSTACVSIQPNNPPTNLMVFDNDGDTVTINSGDSLYTSRSPLAKRPLGTLVGVDPNTTQGDDLTITLVSGADNNNKFQISGDTLYTQGALNTGDELYWVKVSVKDCAGQEITKRFQVYVDDDPVPPTTHDQSYDVDENTASDVVIHTLENDESDQAGLSWSALTSDFTVESDGTIKTKDPLDYETQSQYQFDATLSRDGLDTTITVTITVNDVNEAPTDITLSNNTISEDANSGDVVGTLSFSDPDSNETVTYTETSSNDDFTTHSNSLVVSNNASLTAGDVKTITIQARDNGGLTFSKDFSITITSPSGGDGGTVDCSSDSAFVVWNGSNSMSYYGGGSATHSISKVKYDNKVYKGDAIHDQWYNYNGTPDTFSYWVEIGDCQ